MTSSSQLSRQVNLYRLGFLELELPFSRVSFLVEIEGFSLATKLF